MDSSKTPYLKASSGFVGARTRSSRYRLLLCSASSGIRASANVPTIVETDDKKPSLAARGGVVEGRISALESTMDSMIQKIKRLSLKFDDRGLTDGMY